jgi:hypothetical protein
MVWLLIIFVFDEAGKLKPRIKYFLLHRLVKDRMKNQREKGRNGQRRRQFLLLMMLVLAMLLTCHREMKAIIRT